MAIERKFDKNANLNEYISNEKAPPELVELEYTIGDLHANAWLMLYFLQREGILSLDEEAYKNIQAAYHTDVVKDLIYFSVDKNKAIKAIGDYQNILKNAQFNPAKRIHFVGATLAHLSGYGDHYVLFNYEALSKNHIDFDICLSNHDLQFIVGYWEAKEAGTQEDNFLNMDSSPIYPAWLMPSAVKLNRLARKRAFENEPVLEKDRLSTLIEEHYLPHVNLFSYTITEEGLVLMTHAPVDIGLIKCAAEVLGVGYRDETPQALARTIDAINDRFNKLYLKTGDILKLSATKTNKSGYENTELPLDDDHLRTRLYLSTDSQRVDQVDGDRDKRMRYIVAALTWNRPATQNELQRPATHRGYSIHYVHGHTKTKNDPEHVTNLRSVFGMHAGVYTLEGQKKLQEYEHDYNIEYRTIAARSVRVPANKLKTELENIIEVCQKLATRYQEKQQKYEINEAEEDINKNLHYASKYELICQMLNLARSNDITDNNLKIREICKIYNQNQDELEAENDPTNKGLIKALKVILIGVGLLAGVVPGLIALGVFTNFSKSKTGSINFLSAEANKTSAATELKSTLRKG